MKAPKKPSPGAPRRAPWQWLQRVPPIVRQAALALGFILLVFAALRMVGDEPRDLTEASDAQLKALFFGDRPQLVHCRRAGEALPEAVLGYKALVGWGARVGVAAVNCSRVLPSGKSVWDRFKLKREWNPAVFALAPWTRPKQLAPAALKSAAALRKALDALLLPRGTDVASDRELAKECAFAAAKSSMDTCLVLLKGARFGRTHADIEERLVQTHPRARIVSVDASKLRLSFDGDASADSFALRMHALRNGSHFLSMTSPATLDYMLSFAAQALGSPIEAYSAAEVKLLKVSSSAFKDRTRSAPVSSGSGSGGSGGSGRSTRKTAQKSAQKSDGQQGSAQRSADEDRRGDQEGAGGNEDEDEEVIEL